MMNRRAHPPDDNDPEPTESGGHGTFASPPCLMHEVEDGYLGYLGHGEIVALLNELLEGERADAKALGVMARALPDSEALATLRRVGRDEGKFCAMLRDQIVRFGGQPSERTGAFYDKVLAVEGLADRIGLLNRGQGWVVRKLDEALPKLRDERLHADLEAMRDAHVRNIEACDAISL